MGPWVLWIQARLATADEEWQEFPARNPGLIAAHREKRTYDRIYVRIPAVVHHCGRICLRYRGGILDHLWSIEFLRPSPDPAKGRQRVSSRADKR